MFNPEEIVALAEAGYQDINEELPITRYSRVSIDGVMYQVKSIRPVQYDNSVIHVTARFHGESVKFIRITGIIKWQHGDEQSQGVIGTRFLTIEPAFNTSYMKIVVESGDLLYVRIGDIVAPAVLVKSGNRMYVSPVPNRWDVD